MKAIVVGGGIGGLSGRTGFEAWGRGGRVYWFATKNAPEGEEEAAGRKEELLARFGGWHEPILAVINGIYYREPVQRWGEGRATLLGDAAHPMTPDLGQGACQAIEDAVVLAACLEGEGDVEAALELFEARRTDRTAYVVRRSRGLGRLAQLENPLACGLRDAMLKAIPRRLLKSGQLRDLEPIAGYEAS